MQHNILVGYAQTAAVENVLLIRSTVRTELSGRSGRLSFDRKVGPLSHVCSLLFDVNG